MAITTDEGSYQDYGYTGGMQSIGIPFEGIFKFEVWGAGGTTYAPGTLAGEGKNGEHGRVCAGDVCAEEQYSGRI